MKTKPVNRTNNISAKSFWEKSYHKIKRSRRVLPNPKWRLGHFELHRTFRKHLPQKKGLKLIEIGCGSSIWLPYFYKEFGYNVAGVDYSQVGIDQVKHNLSQVGCNESLIINSDFWDVGEELREQFDILFSFGVVEHFDDPSKVIAYFSNLLKEMGIIITYIPNLTGIMGPLLKFANKEFYKMHQIISMEQLERYHTSSGMNIVCSSYIQPFDLNIINLSKLGPRFATLGHAIFAGLDLPTLAFCKITGRGLPSKTFSSAIIVIAQKQKSKACEHG